MIPKPGSSRPERAYRAEIEDAHATLDGFGVNKGAFLNERVAGLGKMLAQSRVHAQTLALKAAEFVNTVAEVFELPVPTDREPTSALLLAELRKVHEAARADRHNLRSAEETIATLTVERDRARAELDAAVVAMGKPDARRPTYVDSRAVIAALGGMCCALAGGRDANPETWIERATNAAQAARGPA